jgi:choline kinase
MKAMILASGIGKRLMPLTKDISKCLLMINGESILGRQLRVLSEAGIRDIVITTGHHGEKIREFVKQNFPPLNITYVHNPLYSSTNYIYSMWLARDEIDDDIVLLHGDLVFDETLLKKLIDYSEDTAVLVNDEIPLPKKDFKARITDGLVKEIGVNISGRGVFFCAPIYKFSKEDFNKWMDRIGGFIEEGRVKDYAEEALNQISGDVFIYPLYYAGKFCMEIDDMDDLKTARDFFSKMNEIR